MRTNVALAAVALLGGLMSLGCISSYRVNVANGSVELDRSFWSAMDNPEPFADNFEAREKRMGEQFNQVVTVFKSPIREEQKSGLELSPNTWANVLDVHSPAVTIDLRVAHAGHWVLSRQTFARRSGLPLGLGGAGSDKRDQARLLSAYSDEVERTRSVLEALVAR